MTELIKRFQDETGIDLFGGWTYEIVNGMMNPPLSDSPWIKFTEWIAKQLTWRPVSEKPKESDRYIVKYRQGKIVKKFIADYDVVYGWNMPLPVVEIIEWLPIPPAQEGESK